MTNQADKEDSVGEIEALIRQGTTAARVGDKEAARSAFRQATKLAPTNIDALLGLSGVVGTLTEKRQIFQRILEIDPGNLDAREGLTAVERRLSGRDDDPPVVVLEQASAPPIVEQPVEMCYRHPDRETSLHCIQCGRPICGACARMTPVGQICPICRKDRRMSNYKVGPVDLAKGFIAGLIAGLVGGYIA